MGETKSKLILSGNGEVSGGSFERVIINGNGKVNGNIRCNDFESNGTAKIDGDVLSQSTVIKGNTKIRGNLQSNEIEVQGNATIEGRLLFGNLQVFGHASIKNGAKGEDINVEGIVKIGGDCEVETAKLRGAFTIDGLLTGDKIEIDLNGKSSVKEIGGETICVKRENAPLLQLDKIIKVLSKELDSELIEGDFIKLEFTRAKVVRGKEVEIGPGCEIDLVEYTKEVHVSDKASVIEVKKV